MNKHQRGAAAAAPGRAEERTGKVIVTSDQEARAVAREAEVRLKKASADVKEAFKISRHT